VQQLFCSGLVRRFPVKALARTIVEQVDSMIQMFLLHHRQRSSCASEGTDVTGRSRFIGGLFPWTVGIREYSGTSDSVVMALWCRPSRENLASIFITELDRKFGRLCSWAIWSVCSNSSVALTMQEKRHVGKEVALRDLRARKKEKRIMLQEFCATTGYSPPYAAYLLRTYAKRMVLGT